MSQPLLDARRQSPVQIVEIEVPDEAPSFACNVAAAAFSFILLTVLDFFASRYLFFVFPDFDDTWILLLDFLAYGPIIDAALGSIVLTVIAIALQLFQRYRRYPIWLPLVLAWPIAWIVVAPSALKNDDWTSWLILGSLAASVFSCYWLCYLLAREAWD